MSKPINNHIFDEEQRIRTKNLELMRALQDVDRLTSESMQYKLEIIELKEEKAKLQEEITDLVIKIDEYEEK
jgi:chromosome segregation ATPase|tara:strand:- start:208 stop:423 length:216 start_codon:yes stop_codon:yes gene_type:complete